MNNRNKAQILEPLPSVFYTSLGNVDSLLIETIWKGSITPIREVKNLTNNVRNQEERFKEVSRRLADEDFRLKWYNDRHNKKKNSVIPFFFVVMQYAKKLSTTFDWDNPILRSMFRTIDQKRYPNPEKINELAVYLSSEPTLPKESALFAWALMESSRFHAQHAFRTQRDALRKMPEMLRYALSSIAGNHLIPLLQPFAKRTELDIEDSEESLGTSGLVEKAATIRFASKYGSDHSEVRNLASELDQCKATLPRLSSQVLKSAERVSEQPASVPLCQKLLADAEIVLAAAAEFGKKTIIVENRINLLAQQILLEWVPNWQFKFDDERNAKETVATRIDSVLSELHYVEKSIEGLESITYSDIRAKAKAFSISNFDSENSALRPFLERTYANAIEQVKNKNLFEQTREKIFDNANNLSWNAVEDNNISAKEWLVLYEEFHSTLKFDTTFSLLVRHTFEVTSAAFVADLEKSLILEKNSNVFSLINTISRLDYDQIEKIFRKNENLHDIVALAQLQNFFGDLIAEESDAFKWWSREPLSNFAMHYSEDAMHSPSARFFTAIYTTVASDETDILEVLVSLIDVPEAVSRVVEGDDKAEQVELQELLTYRQHGSGTYATLWRAAYLSILDPLLRKINSIDLEAGVRLVSSTLQTIEVDDLYGEWLKSVPSHLWQESQYEKATKVYVNARIKSILIWCERWLNNKAPITVTSSAESLLTREFIRNIEAEIVEIGSWLKGMRRLGNIATRQGGLQFPTSRHPGDTSVLMPRSYLREISGQRQDWRLVLSDKLVNSLVEPSVLDLLAIYRETKNIEAIESLCKLYSDLLQRDEAQAIEADIELQEIKYAIRLGDSKARLELSCSNKGDWVLLEECQQYLSDRRWTKLDASLLLLEMSVEDAEKRRLEEVEKTELINDIIVLNGSCDPDLDLNTLRLKFRETNEHAEPRRAHIKPIEELANTTGVAIEIRDLAERVVDHLNRPSNLPSKADSDFFAEVFKLIFVPIAHQLRRPASLTPSYGHSLERMTLWLLHNLLIEPIGTEAQHIFFGTCVQLYSRIEQINSSDDIEKILSEFSDAGSYRLEPLVPLESDGDMRAFKVAGLATRSDVESRTDKLHAKEIGTLVQAISLWIETLTIEEDRNLSPTDRYQLIKNRSWQRALQCASLPADDDGLVCAIVCSFSIFSPPASTLVSGLALLALKSKTSIFSLVRAMRPDINPVGRWFTCLFSQFLRVPFLQDSDSDYRSSLGSLIRELGESIRHHENGLHVSPETTDSLRILDLAVATDGSLLHLLWDQFSGDKAQAEIRGMLLVVFWKLRLFNCLAECLTLQPIDLEARLAKGYVRLIQHGNENLSADSIENLRRASSAKAYTIFAECVFSELVRNTGLPADISWAGALERTIERGRWRGMLRINPRAINPPLDIDIKFVRTQLLTLVGGESRISISGPFFEERVIELSLDVRTNELQHFDLEIECFFTTVDGTATSSSIKLETELNGVAEFKGLTPHFIDDAFASFPSRHMRGAEFVERPRDEERIEKILFASNDAGSLWMASPRRSGKTSMLFRILDAFSHNVGRDNAILYLTIDRHFESSERFNQWVWSCLRSGKDNEGLRKRIEGLTRLGESLPFDGGVNDFLRSLAELVIDKIPEINRVYFMFDEVDRFAEMHLAGGGLEKTVMQIMWQLRHILSSNSNIGFVFAGSSLARRFFVENSEAAFYNSIPSLELTPFNTLAPEDALISRKVVMPSRLHGKYKLPELSLKHLLAITAGIPYYMKLVAGATYSVARQQTLLVTDVNRGLEAILNKSTGITRIDSLDNPGEDELRTLYASSEIDRIMAKAVLFAIAEMRSPLDQRGVRPGELRNDRSPLVYRYKLSRELIDKGISICTNLGYLKRTLGSELIFTIPILGESIRHRSALLWSTIEEKLETYVRQN